MVTIKYNKKTGAVFWELSDVTQLMLSAYSCYRHHISFLDSCCICVVNYQQWKHPQGFFIEVGVSWQNCAVFPPWCSIKKKRSREYLKNFLGKASSFSVYLSASYTCSEPSDRIQTFNGTEMPHPESCDLAPWLSTHLVLFLISYPGSRWPGSRAHLSNRVSSG